MKGPLISIGTAAIMLTVVLYLSGGALLVTIGMENALRTMLNALPLIVAAFFVIGQLQAIVTPQLVNRLILRFSGLRGIFWGALVGGAFPGPPYVYYPFLAGFGGKRIPLYLFVSFLAGKQVYDFGRLPMEASLISPGIAFFRMLISAPIPILMGLISRYAFGDRLVDEFMTRLPRGESR